MMIVMVAIKLPINLIQGITMYQLNKKQTSVLLQYGKVMFLYKTLNHKILVTIYRDQVLNGIVRIPINARNRSFRLLITIPYWKDTVKNK